MVRFGGGGEGRVDDIRPWWGATGKPDGRPARGY